MNQNNGQLAKLLQSPDNGDDLSIHDNQLAKADGSFVFPNISDIPWLFEFPASSLLHWQTKSQMAIYDSTEKIRGIKEKMSLKGLPSKTKERMKLLSSSEEHNVEILKKTLQGLFAYDVSSLNAVEALMGKTAASQEIRAYENALIRDWAVDDHFEAINDAALELIKGHLPKDLQGGKLLTLGSGGARLPMDLCRLLRPDVAIACDINPFATLMAQNIYQGGRFDYFEFPGIPKDFESSALKRQLAMTKPRPEHFYFLLADALNFPFKKDSMDLVFTPWFIDIIHQDFSVFISQLNPVIKEGGYWISFGPLHFDHRGPEGRYSFEEIKILAEKNGFAIESHGCEFMPYLMSPGSAYQRHDQVHCIVAKKVKTVDKPEQNTKYLPEWILDPSIPVPAEEYILNLQASHGLRSQILNQVDGKRSILDIIPEIGKALGLPHDQAVQMVLGYLTEVYEQQIQDQFRGLA